MLRRRVVALPAAAVFLLTLVRASPAAAQALESPAREAEERKARERLVHFGPLVGVGFPRPLAIEAIVKIKGLIGVGVEYSFLPRMKIAGADTRFNALAVDLRFFPFGGAFFIGLRGGRQWLDAATTVNVGPLAFRESMEASTWFLNPRVGFLYTFQSGLTLGMDAGLQFPISPSFERTGLAARFGASAMIDGTLASVADILGNGVTPTIDLLRVGFLF
jgi:hypothetical protein